MSALAWARNELHIPLLGCGMRLFDGIICFVSQKLQYTPMQIISAQTYTKNTMHAQDTQGFRKWLPYLSSNSWDWKNGFTMKLPHLPFECFRGWSFSLCILQFLRLEAWIHNETIPSSIKCVLTITTVCIITHVMEWICAILRGIGLALYKTSNLDLRYVQIA